MILYFTGTGNSRYVADMLADLTGDEALCVNSFIKSGEKKSFESERPYVFVSPVYVSALPLAFCDFIRNSEFLGCQKAYYVQTCAGGMGGCPEYARRLSREKGFAHMGTAQVTMPQNYLVYFKPKEKSECEGIIDAAGLVIRAFSEPILAGTEFPDPGMKKWEYVSTEMILDMYYKHFMPAKPFRTTEDCIGCGRCESLCPLNNIKLTEGRPVWGDNCTHCMACISLCPKQAIEYGKKSVGKPRYSCRKYVK